MQLYGVGTSPVFGCLNLMNSRGDKCLIIFKCATGFVKAHFRRIKKLQNKAELLSSMWSSKTVGVRTISLVSQVFYFSLQKKCTLSLIYC